LKHQPFYVQNCISVENVSPSQIELFASQDSVGEIISNRAFTVPLETLEKEEKDSKQGTIEWNIDFVKAPVAWQRNITGTGFTVANADTGVEWNHEALRNNYRGNNNGNIDHNYAWWDGIRRRIRPGQNRCGYNITAPCDDNGHGTHTTGTAAGGSPTRRIGVAPGAKWIACRNMDAGDGRPDTYIQCLEFFLAPFNLQRQNPNPDLRPVAIGNSYGCPRSEECEPNSLRQASDALRAGGVFMSVSAGNSGPGCSSVSDPPSLYGSVITVGASGTRTHSIAGYSSRGPVTVDQSNRRKPDLTAPGSAVTSCLPGGRYGSFSGTSMASPHVNGAVALLWQRHPNLVRNVDATQRLLETTCVPQQSTACGSSGVPNNVYGYGSMNIEAAINRLGV